MARKGNYPSQLQPDAEPGELSKKISFMQQLSDWKFTNDPDLVEGRVRWYFDQCALHDVRPTVANLAVALNTSRETLWNWQRRGGRLGEIIDQAKRILNALLEDWSVNGKINPVASIWLQKNHFGYRDLQTFEVTRADESRQLEASMTPAQIAARIEADIPIDDYSAEVLPGPGQDT